MEAYFITIFEDVRYERCPILLLGLVEPNILKQSKFTDHEIDIMKNKLKNYPSLNNEPELLKKRLEMTKLKT